AWYNVPIVNIVPAYDSLMITFSSPDRVEEAGTQLAHILAGLQLIEKNTSGQEMIIPVCYDPSLGNDLEKMGEILQMNEQSIVEMHLDVCYEVYMLGFLPGFAYMGRVHEQIATPRKDEPVATRAGAVGIAGIQTGIYPFNSPGGWHIVGYTPLIMFDPARSRPALLHPGDRVRFRQISLSEFEQLNQK
ncbi:MAG TPA: 5-oxoprolinase subunit PxpB, partial [Phnomibacter sp.]|nr:5-oxoprolinase subunit PxpB [Phnomibacter sp.]